jgi:hypothetical protein
MLAIERKKEKGGRRVERGSFLQANGCAERNEGKRTG